MRKIFNLAKNHKIITSVLILTIVVGGIWWRKSHPSTAQAQYITQAAEKTTIISSVTASGQVSAENQLDLKPGGSGALISVNAKVGDYVKAGQIIAVVDQSTNNVSLAQARASLLNAQANYDKLIAGLTGSDLSAAQKTVADSEKAAEKAKENLEKAKRDYNTTLDDQQQAINKANNKLLNSGLAAVPNNSLSNVAATISGTYTGTTEGSYNISFYETGNGTYYQVSGLGNESGRLERGINLPLGNGLSVNFSTSGTLNSAATSYKIDVPNKTSSEYYNNLNLYNDALNNQTKAIQASNDAIKSAQDAVFSAEDSLSYAQLQFAEKMAPADNVSITQAKAAILSAQASLQVASNNYNNNILKMPFDGIVAAVNNKKGDQVTAVSVVATIITKQQLATVSLNELDAAKVKVDQKVTLTFDAIENLELTGRVVEVGSIGTVNQGVVSFPVKIGFDTQDERVKPSMSVSANIITDVKTDVLAVPSSAIKTNGNIKYVQMLNESDQLENLPIEAGLSNDTMTEIISGLVAGEKVITQTITPAVAGAQTTRTGTGIPGLSGSTGNLSGNRGGGQFFIQQSR